MTLRCKRGDLAIVTSAPPNGGQMGRDMLGRIFHLKEIVTDRPYPMWLVDDFSYNGRIYNGVADHILTPIRGIDETEKEKEEDHVAA